MLWACRRIENEALDVVAGALASHACHELVEGREKPLRVRRWARSQVDVGSLVVPTAQHGSRSPIIVRPSLLPSSPASPSTVAIVSVAATRLRGRKSLPTQP